MEGNATRDCRPKRVLELPKVFKIRRYLGFVLTMCFAFWCCSRIFRFDVCVAEDCKAVSGD